MTLKCVAHLHTLVLYERWEIIVVDNASNDGTSEALQRAFPAVQVITNLENRRFAAACNQAASIAKGAYWLFLNSDARPKQGAIETMVRFLQEQGDKIGAVGPRVLNPNGSVQSEGHPFPGLAETMTNLLGTMKWPLPQRLKKCLIPRGQHRFEQGKIRQVGWISGCCMLVSQRAWQQVGGFDECLYFYREDIEWPYRALKKGVQTWVYPEVEAVHAAGSSTRSAWLKKRDLMLARGEKHYYRLTQGLVHHGCNYVVIILLYPLIARICQRMGRIQESVALRRKATQSRRGLAVIMDRQI